MMKLRVLGLGAVALLVAASSAFAQNYPNQMVRIVVPFSAGSNTDAQARIIADKLADLWKQQVIVENRPGVAGTASVAKAMPDGYTLMLIPHKGAPEVMTSILRNDAQLYFASANTIGELLEAKKIKVLAVSGGKRFPSLPDVPTASESGLPDYVYESWFGVLAPAGVPKPILNKVSQDIARVLALPDVALKMKNQGLVVVTNTPDQFDRLITTEAERYGKILRDAGVGAN